MRVSLLMMNGHFVLLSTTTLGIALLMLLSACTVEKSKHELHAGNCGRNYGGVYHINMIRGNPSGLDPVLISSKLADDIALQIYDRLISFDSTLNVVPELATGWEISADGCRYTFRLRTDVRFQDDACFPGGHGRKMTAADVAYSLRRCCDPTTRTVAYWVFQDKVVGANRYFESRRSGNKDSTLDIEGIHCENDSTLCIDLIHSYAPFLMQLANALGCVVPLEAVNYYGKDFFRHPVGTGAFCMTRWTDDHEMILTRNPHYWKVDAYGNRLPFFESIRVSFITDDKVQFQEFMSGHLDESFTIPTEMFPVLFDPNTREARKNFDFVIQKRPAMLSWFIDFLCTRKPFDNVEVRRAFSYAVDREKLVRYVLRNAPYAPAVHGITPPVMPGYDIDSIHGFAFDTKRAQECLARAGFPHGKGFPTVILSVYPEPRLMQVAESVQNMLSENLNINVRIQVLQFAQLLEKSEAGELMMWGTRWYGDYPDVENYLSLWDGSLVPKDSSLPSYPNSTRYSNLEVNKLLDSALHLGALSDRYAVYRKAERLATADAPSLLLFYEMHYRLVQASVRGYPLDAMDRVQLKEAWFAY